MRDRYQQGLSERHKHYLMHLTWIYWEVLHSGWYWTKNFIPSHRKTPTNFLTNPINSWNSCPPRVYGLTRGLDGSRDSSAMWQVMMRLQEVWYHREWGGGWLTQYLEWRESWNAYYKNNTLAEIFKLIIYSPLMSRLAEIPSYSSITHHRLNVNPKNSYVETLTPFPSISKCDPICRGRWSLQS